HIFYGKQHEILESILDHDPNIECVYVNKDYTPYSIDRENRLRKIADKHKVKFESHEDYLLHNMNTIKNKSGSYYSVFTPFYHEGIKHAVPKIKLLARKN